jgi:hypothetical protein
MEPISGAVLLGVLVLAGAFLFTPYEARPEGAIAFVMVAAAVAGFLMHPRRDVFYLRSAVRLSNPARKHALEHDFL